MRNETLALDGQLVLASTPTWVGLEDLRGLDVLILCFLGGTPGQDPVISLEQARDSAGSGAKALEVARYYKKEGAPSVSAVGQFSGAIAGTPGTFGGAEEPTSAENEAMWLIPVSPRDLDQAGGYTHVRASQTGGQAGTSVTLYIGRGARHRGIVQPSALD